MRNITVSFILIAAGLSSGCATRSNNLLEDKEWISYYDRNSDGKVDRENHQHTGMADADWELQDDDYDGKYEKKILYGYVLEESAVHVPVPTGIRIERKR